MNKASLQFQLTLLIALLQGLSLLLLHHSINHELWGNNHYHWLYGLYALALTGPTLFLLSVTDDNNRKLLPLLLPYTGLIALLAGYSGTQVNYPDASPFQLVPTLILTLGIASFKWLMYCQSYLNGQRIQYSHIFEYSWRNALVLALSLLMTLIFWGILMLWGALFAMIGIDFFADLFEQKWFYYPVLNLAMGIAILMFRQLDSILDSIRKILHILFKLLLPLLSTILLLFVVTLPFQGLSLLENGIETPLLLWLMALLLFAYNAVHQDQISNRVYPKWIDGFVTITIALSPVLSSIAAYALSLRVNQYGWTEERAWGALVTLVLAGYTFAYSYAIVRHKLGWLGAVGQVNIRMGALISILMLLTASPLLDLRKLTVASQLQRLEEGKVSIEAFDAYHFKHQLARPGYEALQSLQTRYQSDPHALALLTDPKPSYMRDSALTFSEFKSRLTQYTQEQASEALLREAFQVMQTEHHHISALNMDVVYLLDADFSPKYDQEYLLISAKKHYLNAHLLVNKKGEWHSHNVNIQGSEKALAEQLQQTTPEWQQVPPDWQDMLINGVRLRVSPAY